MSRIPQKNTKPELAVRSLLHKFGFRFRIHVKSLFGCPDIVLAKYKTVIFVNGCFWHRHEDCKFAYTPKSREEFWNRKFKANIERHQKVVNQLIDAGWKVIVVWECETIDASDLISTLDMKIKGQDG